jgi:hypothetical protein
MAIQIITKYILIINLFNKTNVQTLNKKPTVSTIKIRKEYNILPLDFNCWHCWLFEQRLIIRLIQNINSII